MSLDKRQDRRYSVQLTAELTIDGDVVTAATRNVSASGVALDLQRPLPDGATVDITLFLTQDGIEDPHEEPFESPATVMWAAESDTPGTYIAGVQFVEVSAGQKVQLDRFLAAID